MSLTPKGQSQGQEFKRFTGVIPFQVVAINPTKDELEKLGVSIKNEPTYKGEKDGYGTLRIDVWLRNPKLSYMENGIEKTESFTTKVSYWIEDKILRTSKNKARLVNNYAMDTFADSVDALIANPKMSWFPQDGIREAYVGEAELLNFLYTWLGYSRQGDPDKNISPDKLKLSLSIPEMIKTENVSELRNAIKTCMDSGNGVKFLLGVQEKENKLYQTVYTGLVMFPKQKNYDNLNKLLNEEYTQFKADYQDSFDVKVYNDKPTVTSTDVKVETKNNADDLPF